MSASARLSHPHSHLGAFPFARTENDRTLRGRREGSRTSAMRVPLKTELLPANFAPHQATCGGAHDHQRNRLLPIHAQNISPIAFRATNDLRSAPYGYCDSHGKIGKAVPHSHARSEDSVPPTSRWAVERGNRGHEQHSSRINDRHRNAKMRSGTCRPVESR